MKTPNVEVVEQHIRDWAQARKSNISLRTFAWEIDAIRTATGVRCFRNVLDIGCGSGIFLITCVVLGLAKRGLGFDPTIMMHVTTSQELIEGSSLVGQLALDVKLENRSLEGLLDASDGEHSYDLIVFRGRLHHIYERASAHADDEGVVAQCVEDLARVRR